MEIFCLGLSHHTAPVELRERFAISDSRAGFFAKEISATGGIAECVVVSTCNRVEFYGVADRAEAGFEQLERFLRERDMPVEPGAFVRRAAGEGVRHLFRVVSGLDSMVLGETEVLGQVKKAYQGAQVEGATARHLNKLFQRAFNVAKEVRSRTQISRGSVSVGSVAVELAERIFGNLAACRVMILGAGEMSELTAGAMQARGVKSIFVANRSHDRAVALAERMGGKAVHFDEWAREFAGIDILIGSTSAPHHVLSRAQLETVMETRPDRPLFCIDLAVPRDIDPAVNALDGVYLYDIDSLQAIASESMEVRRKETVLCEKLIDVHVREFGQWMESGRPLSMRPSVSPRGEGMSGAEPRGI
jgi:glutamyl-tRNA reductase